MKVYLWLMYVWISFSWCSFKLLVDWYWDIYKCHKFVTGFVKKCKPNQDQVNLFLENREKVNVKWIGTVNLKLESVSCSKLFVTVYILSMRHCLFSFSRLDKLGCTCSLVIPLLFEPCIVGNGVLDGSLYRLNECVSS